ncbi:MAG TPA: Hsp70 family protein [Pirellulales bacterium]|nr:Hsp70 family protein [Pirellulales bacterium]
MSHIDEQSVPSRYIVGIDLGTTNSAVAYVDGADEPSKVHTLAIAQVVAPGEVDLRETLPSFRYEAAPGEFADGALRLPWHAGDPKDVVGVFARDHGTNVPGRLISSAKSWLCHPGVDRTAELLPWHPAPDVERLSPVEASSLYLAHIRETWNNRFPNEPLERQDIVLTLPASFDEVARELTVRAARLAGLPRVVLIEEPQAAFYAWIYHQGDRWEQLVSPGQKILVCDIGGGTSDFTLIRVRRGEGGKIRFHRVAVGEHLLLGGDNLDLTLAQHIERRLTRDGKLEPRQWAVLVRTCRRAKETLLASDAPERLTLNLPGSGAKLIGGGLQVEVARDEVERLLVDGFLPRVALDDKPAARRSGFQEFGLPYAADAAMTRYLAAFLSAHRHVALDLDNESAASDHDPARPDLVLFNGGFFASPVLRRRLLDVLGSWFMASGGAAWQPHVLANDRLDLAVAQGAAYYGIVRRGVGVRISAGLARTYYVGVGSGEGETAAVCLLPAGIEEGQAVDLTDRKFELTIREPVEFPIHVSSTRLTDKPGELLPVDPEQMTSLPPIRTVLESAKKGGGKVLVNLHARLTEIGTLDLWCSEIDSPRTWRLQFDVRAATQTDREMHQGRGEAEGIVDEEAVEASRAVILTTFGGASGDKTADAHAPAVPPLPASVVKRLEQASGLGRRDWPMTLLRSLWEALVEVEPGRRRSAEHEARWLYLAGFSLRPGYGLAVDDWRVAQTWRLLQGKRIHHTPACRVEWLILWRRIAGGLNAGQQRALAEPLLAALRAAKKGGASRRPDVGASSHELAEAWRLLGSLELVSVPTKVELANAMLDLARREKVGAVRDAALWATGRLAARVPMYGPLNTVVGPAEAQRWIAALLEIESPPASVLFSLVQMARRTGDRYRDVDDALRQRVLGCLDRQSAPPHYHELVSQGGQLDEEEAGLMFGESLPRGLRLAQI